MLRRVAGQVVDAVSTAVGAGALARHFKGSFISTSESHQDCLTQVAAPPMALHARCSFGAFPPAKCWAASGPPSSFHSSSLQQQPKERGITEDGRRQHNGFLLHLSGVRLAKMGPSKGRGPLIAKYAPVGFKKGFGAVGLGRHTKKGFFLINSMLIPKLHVPENAGSELKPYVSPETFKVATQKFWDENSNPMP